MALNHVVRRFCSVQRSSWLRANVPEIRIPIAPLSTSSFGLPAKNCGTDTCSSLLYDRFNVQNHARRHFHVGQWLAAGTKREILSRGQMAASMPKLDEGTEGEKLADLNV